MGLDLVVLFCAVYAGLVLTGMWFFVGPPRQQPTQAVDMKSKVVNLVRDR